MTKSRLGFGDLMGRNQKDRRDGVCVQKEAEEGGRWSLAVPRSSSLHRPSVQVQSHIKRKIRFCVSASVA